MVPYNIWTTIAGNSSKTLHFVNTLSYIKRFDKILNLEHIETKIHTHTFSVLDEKRVNRVQCRVKSLHRYMQCQGCPMSAPLSHIIIVNIIIAGSATSATNIMLCIPCYMLGADVKPGLCNHRCLGDHKSHAINKFSRKRNVNKNL